VLSRNDVTVSLGWYGAEYRQLDRYDRWNASLFAGLGSGHYWTDHHKTEVEGAWLSRVSEESYGPVVINGVPISAESRYRIQGVKLSVGQLYQFGRNQWVHPFLGAGADIDWLQLTLDRPAQSQFGYVPSDRTSRPLLIPARHEKKSATEVRPYLKTGLKMYTSDRGFFTTEIKLGLGSGIDQMLWRIGAGFDF
jgi:hypothetical protein